jgi:hypothetical protein
MDNAREQGNQYLSEMSRLQVQATRLQVRRREALADLEMARTRSLDRQREQHRVETSLRSVTKQLETAKAGLENMQQKKQVAHAAVERLKTSNDQAREARIAAEEADQQRKYERRTIGDMVELETECQESTKRLEATQDQLEQVTAELAAVEAKLREENLVARANLEHEKGVFKAEEVALVEEEVELHHNSIRAVAAQSEREAADIAASQRQAEILELEENLRAVRETTTQTLGSLHGQRCKLEVESDELQRSLADKEAVIDKLVNTRPKVDELASAIARAERRVEELTSGPHGFKAVKSRLAVAIEKSEMLEGEVSKKLAQREQDAANRDLQVKLHDDKSVQFKADAETARREIAKNLEDLRSRLSAQEADETTLHIKLADAEEARGARKRELQSFVEKVRSVNFDLDTKMRHEEDMGHSMRMLEVERNNFKGALEADIRELQKAHRLLMLQVEESEKTCDRLTKEVGSAEKTREGLQDRFLNVQTELEKDLRTALSTAAHRRSERAHIAASERTQARFVEDEVLSLQHDFTLQQKRHAAELKAIESSNILMKIRIDEEGNELRQKTLDIEEENNRRKVENDRNKEKLAHLHEITNQLKAQIAVLVEGGTAAARGEGPLSPRVPGRNPADDALALLNGAFTAVAHVDDQM